MYEPNNHSLLTYTSAPDFFLGHFPSLEVAALPPPLLIPTAAAESIEFDPMALPLRSEVRYSSSSRCSSYGSPSSLTSYSTPSPSLMQRSVSTQSLQKNNNNNNNSNNGYRKMAELMMESENSPVVVRRVFSTVDLQGINIMQHCHRSESPLSNEHISIIQGMSKACRYSPEEKKERIERYRSKRNQRNFNKKIKYACRKTLADNRPRIRGRFAKNDEIEKNFQNQWSHMSMKNDEYYDNWIHFLDSFSANLIP
ncbi:hypothetical protein ACSBR2_002501 [Camellia fascicularis]